MGRGGVERLEEQLVGGITFPLVNWLSNRRRILATWRRLLETERADAETLRRIQLERLRRVLAFADAHVPFYRKRFAAAGLVPSRVRSLDDLACLPPLERTDVIDHLDELVDSRQAEALRRAVASTARGEPIFLARFQRHRLVRNSTSGSTGTPAVFVEDGTTTAVSWANELRFRHAFGIGPGAREARFQRIASEAQSASWALEVRRRLWNQLSLPGIHLNEADHAESLRRMRRFRPRLFWGPTTGLVQLAEYLETRGETLGFPLELVVCWSEPLAENQKRQLERSLGCPAASLYSAREIGHIASTCPDGRMHVHQENFLVETTRPRSPDCPGEILVTALFDSPMPFIRYRLGDLVELGGEPCPCGRTLQVLKSISGRAVDVFVTDDGRYFSGASWPVVFAKPPLCDAVRRFQVVYRADGGLRFRIVRTDRYTPEVEAFLRNYVAEKVLADPPPEVEYPDEIPLDPSGKAALVVDERR